MQIKNLLVFLVVAALILAGWGFLQNQLFPPKPRDQKEEQAKKDGKTAKDKKEAQGEKDRKGPKAGPGGQEELRFAGLISVPPTAFAKAAPKKAPEEAAPALVQSLPEDLVTLGGDATSPYHLQVVLTRLGGGVYRVVLVRFEGADADGKGTGRPLELIPGDPMFPSYLLYSYPARFDDKDPHPLEGLGRIKWDFVRGKDGRVLEKDKDGVERVTFRAAVPGYADLVVTKTYELAPKTYHLGLSITVRDERKTGGADQAARPFRYQLGGALRVPVEGKWYTNVTRNAYDAQVDPKDNVWRAVEDARRVSIRDGGDRVPEGQLGDNAIQYAVTANQYFASGAVVDNQAPRAGFPPDYLAWARPVLVSTEVKGKVFGVEPKRRRLALEDEHRVIHSFLLAPDCEVLLGGQNETVEDLKQGQVVIVRYHVGDEPRVATEVRSAKYPHYPQFDDISVSVNSREIPLKPGESVTHNYLLYNGPVKVRLLGQMSGPGAVAPALVDRYENDLHLNTLTDYHSDSAFGRFSNTIHWTWLLIKCTNLMHGLLWVLHSILPVYGLNIILLTVLVRGLMFPISRRQAAISVKMQALAPEMKKIQEKYKHDPQAKTQAVMDLYRRHGVNPLGGCLPMLLQLPVFLGLYYALQESVFFRLAGFLWIDNLAAPDMLFYWGPNIPLVSDFLGPYFNLLPVVAVSLMIVQQKLMTPPAMDETQETQQKVMKYMMIFFGLMFYKVAAGLVIYFIASSLWGLAERKMLPKRQALAAVPAVAAGPGPGKPPRAGGPGRGGAKARKASPKNPDGTLQKVKDWWAEVLKQAKKK